MYTSHNFWSFSYANRPFLSADLQWMTTFRTDCSPLSFRNGLPLAAVDALLLFPSDGDLIQLLHVIGRQSLLGSEGGNSIETLRTEN